MALTPGAVIVLRDRRVRPRNRLKWHVCVCPDRRLFLRINSKPLWPPWHLIEAAHNAFLEHDSYVELISLHFFAESELREARTIGEMSPSEQGRLAATALHAETLNEEQKDLIRERLGSRGRA